jgi:hypothetical protein
MKLNKSYVCVHVHNLVKCHLLIDLSRIVPNKRGHGRISIIDLLDDAKTLSDAGLALMSHESVERVLDVILLFLLALILHSVIILRLLFNIFLIGDAEFEMPDE